MGRRKRGSDHTFPDRPPHLSGIVPFSNQMDVRSVECSSRCYESPRTYYIWLSRKPINEFLCWWLANMDDQSLARPVFMKRSRHQYSHQYCRRGSASQPNTYRGNRVSTIHEERPAFKFAAHCNSETSDRIDGIGSTFLGPERIMYNSLGKNAISSHGMRMLCGICHKLMKRKLCFLGNTLSSHEPPVAAVLVCGHVYHADCLENRSSVEDRSDPPCPLCTEMELPIED